MANKASKRNHIPIRTCVICKEKDQKKKYQRFVIKDGKIHFDHKQTLPGRGYYCCTKEQCKKLLEKWIKKAKRK